MTESAPSGRPHCRHPDACKAKAKGIGHCRGCISAVARRDYNLRQVEKRRPFINKVVEMKGTLSASMLAERHGVTKGVIIGIWHRYAPKPKPVSLAKGVHRP